MGVDGLVAPAVVDDDKQAPTALIGVPNLCYCACGTCQNRRTNRCADVDTHVVSMVYIREMSKWVLFDPNNNAYFTDKDGIALSPLEARHLLGRDEACVAGTPTDNSDGYKQYMAKNLFYIKFWAKNTFGTDSAENQTIYFLAPHGFDVKGREIAYCEYAISINPIEYRKGWEDYLEEIREQQVITVSEEQFLRIV